VRNSDRTITPSTAGLIVRVTRAPMEAGSRRTTIS